MLQALGTPALTDGIDPLFSGLQHLLRTTGALLDHCGQLARRLSDSAQQGLVLDNSHIFLHISCRGGDLHQLQHIAPGGIFVIYAVLPHVIQYRHRIDGRREVKHGVDRLIDLPVLPQVEIFGPQGLDDLGHTPGVYQHRPQHRLFCLHTVGQLAGQQIFIHLLTSRTRAGRRAGPPAYSSATVTLTVPVTS